MQNSGQIAPLDEIIRLKEKYLFRVVLDESHSFGVLGSSGRGLAEHYGVPVCLEPCINYIISTIWIIRIANYIFLNQVEKIDIITAGMGNALATDGGFCTGSVRVVDHQVATLYHLHD